VAVLEGLGAVQGSLEVNAVQSHWVSRFT